MKYGSETMKTVKAKQLRRDIAPTVVSLAIMGMGMKAYKDKYEDY